MTTALRFSSIDEYLGDGSRRFFSEGFRRVGQRLTDIRVEPARPGQGSVSATAAVTYPEDWSRKDRAMELRPHLSSVDVMVLAVQLVEVYLTRVHGLTPEQRAASWLRRFAVRSSAGPQEDLGRFPVVGRLRRTLPGAGRVRPAVSAFDLNVGALNAVCEVEHDAGSSELTPVGYADAEQALGPAGERYYGDGFRARRHTLTDVRLDPDGQRVAALATFADPDGRAGLGFAAAYQPGLTMVDCFLALAQLAQLLVYHEDGITRGQSNTLWMRRLTMTCERPEAPLGAGLPLAVTRHRSDALEFSGARWRKADMSGDFHTIQARSSMAHQLPR
ncbi:AvrD family protein [Streptomyces triticirhizae]|uniref:AvrD family protein n=1 Tax=Streptomyces triticirhizae TaxID=2483353 RepID=UPI00131557D9|nr:AvrD family protein [Streptomyces triticirhizae]